MSIVEEGDGKSYADIWASDLKIKKHLPYH